VLAPATLAAFPSTRAIPDRDVFYVVDLRSPDRLGRIPTNAVHPPASQHGVFFPFAPLKLVRCTRFDSCAPAHLKLAPSQCARCFPRSFTFYVAFPISSIRPLGLPIYVARVSAAPFSPLPSSLCLLCRSTHSLHSGDVMASEQMCVTRVADRGELPLLLEGHGGWLGNKSTVLNNVLVDGDRPPPATKTPRHSEAATGLTSNLGARLIDFGAGGTTCSTSLPPRSASRPG